MEAGAGGIGGGAEIVAAVGAEAFGGSALHARRDGIQCADEGGDDQDQQGEENGQESKAVVPPGDEYRCGKGAERTASHEPELRAIYGLASAIGEEPEGWCDCKKRDVDPGIVACVVIGASAIAAIANEDGGIGFKIVAGA